MDSPPRRGGSDFTGFCDGTSRSPPGFAPEEVDDNPVASTADGCFAVSEAPRPKTGAARLPAVSPAGLADAAAPAGFGSSGLVAVFAEGSTAVGFDAENCSPGACAGPFGLSAAPACCGFGAGVSVAPPDIGRPASFSGEDAFAPSGEDAFAPDEAGFASADDDLGAASRVSPWDVPALDEDEGAGAAPVPLASEVF